MFRLFGVLLLCSVAFAQDVESVTRVKGGVTATPGEFKYQASIQVDGQHICGGALITRRHVVTSASCLVRILQNRVLLERTQVMVGSISLIRDGIYFGISRLSIHPEFRYNSEWASFANDIGILHLRGEVRNSQWVAPVNLPGITELPPNSDVLFTGWGSVISPAGPTVELLQKATLRYIPIQECQRFYPNLGLKNYQLCTSANYYVGTCTTDSGSPVVYNNQLVGISTGLHGCARGTPDVFTKVSYYLKFILDEVEYPSSA